MAPFSRRSTALDVVEGIDLSGKTAVVTGGNSGIGVETVRALATAGARVILTSRNVEAGQKVADDIKAGGAKGPVEVAQLDLADLASVARFEAKLEAEPRLDALVCNAGVMMCPFQHTKDGFEMQIGTNHFGHFALVEPLLPKLRAQDHPSRVVLVSSMGHLFQRSPLDMDDLHYENRPYGRIAAYGQSKAANVMFAKELAERCKESLVEAFSLHPGSIYTNLTRYMISPAGILSSVAAYMGPMLGVLKTIPQGAATTVYAAVSPDLAGKSGAYLVDCKITEPSKIVQDREAAAKLWEVTKEQIAAKSVST